MVVVITAFMTFGMERTSFAMDCVQGSGRVETHQRTLARFTAIRVAGGFTVYVRSHAERSVEITGDDNILPFVITSVENDELSVRAEGSICLRSKLTLRISLENLTRISFTGANEAYISGIDTKVFTVAAAGASDIYLDGATDTFTARLAGAVTLHADKLRTLASRISARGACEAFVFASRHLTTEIRGAGTVSCYGNPPEIVKSISGAGQLLLPR